MGLDYAFRMSISSWVKATMAAEDLSMEDVAQLSGVSDTTVFRVAQGHPVYRSSMTAVLGALNSSIFEREKVFRTHHQTVLNMPEKK